MAQPEAALAVWQQALQPEDVRTTLLEHIARIAQAQEHNAAEVLHVGCGAYSRRNCRRFSLMQVGGKCGWISILRSSPTLSPASPTCVSSQMTGLTPYIPSVTSSISIP